jgi:hypothetical protein
MDTYDRMARGRRHPAARARVVAAGAAATATVGLVVSLATFAPAPDDSGTTGVQPGDGPTVTTAPGSPTTVVRSATPSSATSTIPTTSRRPVTRSRGS